MWKIQLNCQHEQAELISDFLTDIGANAVTMNAASTERVFAVNNEQPLWQEVCITGFFDDSTNCDVVIEQLNKTFSISSTFEKTKETDWQENFRQQFKPTQFGKRLWVYPAWEKIPNNLPHVVTIEPGLAFGTGNHPTTAMCLTWLDKHVENNMTVIDYGCGTGILAIAAQKLGAEKVYGVDNDPQALVAARENTVRNNITQNIEYFLPEEAPTKQVDIVIANILANPLIELAPTLASFLKSTSKLALSGILEQQSQSVIDAYSPYIKLSTVNQQQDWVLLSNTHDNTAYD